MTSTWHVAIDIGGTFTDVVAVDASAGHVRQLKVPSSRSDPAAGMLNGLRALSEEAGVAAGDMRLVLHGTTLATNAIIERQLAKTALVTTKGFQDVLEIGRHWRTDLYDPFIEVPQPLVPRSLRLEVTERIAADGAELVPLSDSEALEIREQLLAADVHAIGVVFLHSYRNPAHEQAMSDLLRRGNSHYVCSSSELSRELREYERTSTTVLNASLMPLINTYLDQVETGLAETGNRASLLITQSNGGALSPDTARDRPVSLALSGPVGGVVASVEVGRQLGHPNLISFDMGGTSTDISIISDHEARYASELEVGDLPVRLPSIDVHSIGAGGGSIASVDSGGGLRVGPESAGSEPGPAAYGGGGVRPTVTDCQLQLGRLTPEVPLAGRLRLHEDLASAAIDSLTSPLGLTGLEAAAGVIEVANAAMERAVRVSLRKHGDDPRDFAIIAFGGAGPLHAADLARRLGIHTVIVPPHPGTFSALGFLAADVRRDFAISDLRRSDDGGLSDAAEAAFSELERQAAAELGAQAESWGAPLGLERSCDVRYPGQAYEVNVPVAQATPDQSPMTDAIEHFHRLHQRAYGFSSPDQACEVVTFRVTATAALPKHSPGFAPDSSQDAHAGTRKVYFTDHGWVTSHVHERAGLCSGTQINGPAIIHQVDATTLVPEHTAAEIDGFGNIVMTVEVEGR